METEEKKPKNSKAKIAANNRYVKKAYERIDVTLPKGEKQIIKDHATSMNESVNHFINRAIQNQMTIDNNNKK